MKVRPAPPAPAERALAPLEFALEFSQRMGNVAQLWWSRHGGLPSAEIPGHRLRALLRFAAPIAPDGEAPRGLSSGAIIRHAVVALVAASLAAGCASLLPKARTEVTSAWRSFVEAKDAIERIVPNRTTTSELHALGIDPYASANVQLLSYSDILLRFPLSGAIAQDRLDAGLRTCLQAGKACTGYAIAVRETKRDRVGGFWRDSLRFRRVVEVSGWSFNALILLVDDRVVYALHGGQPNLREQEVTRQPLGPLQNWGDALPVGNLLR